MASDIISKLCPRCQARKPTSDFSKNSSKRGGLASYCKPCLSAWMRAYNKTPQGRTTHLKSVANWSKGDKGKASRRKYLTSERGKEAAKAAWKKRISTPDGKQFVRARNLRLKFGMTVSDYDSLLRSQGGVCAICGRQPNAKRRLAVDHDHTTGNVRGILCSRCNVALGYFGDTTHGVKKALKYLFAKPE